MSKMKNIMIDKMNEESFVVLKPGEVWEPSVRNEQKCPTVKQQEKTTKPEDCKYHDWADVLLFRTTVTECKKCGKLKE